MTKNSAANRTVDATKNKIKQRQARVGIIGLGYVGLPLALLFTEQKFAVTGFDIDQRKVDTLAQGGSYIYRITAEEIQRPSARLFRHLRLRPYRGDGRDHHLRSHPAQSISRAGPQLHHRYHTRHRAAPPGRASWWFWRARPTPAPQKK